MDFWDSEDAFLAFVEKARPIFDRGGVRTFVPNVQEAVNVILK